MKKSQKRFSLEDQTPSDDMRRTAKDITAFVVPADKQINPLQTWKQKFFFTHTINDASIKRNIR